LAFFLASKAVLQNNYDLNIIIELCWPKFFY